MELDYGLNIILNLKKTPQLLLLLSGFALPSLGRRDGEVYHALACSRVIQFRVASHISRDDAFVDVHNYFLVLPAFLLLRPLIRSITAISSC